MIGLVKQFVFAGTSKAQEVLSSHFDLLAEMVALPIYYHLDYPRAFAALPSIRQGISSNMPMHKTKRPKSAPKHRSPGLARVFFWTEMFP